jgi:hypothetical protein
MTNSDKFLIAVQTGLINSKLTGTQKALLMLKAIKLSEKYMQEDGWHPSDYAMEQDVENFLNYALFGTQYEWIVSKVGKPGK